MTEIMRNLVIDQTRKKQAAMHGGGCSQVTLSHVDSSAKSTDADLIYLLDIDRSLKNLGTQDSLLEQMMVMRFYGGVEIKDIAETFDLSLSTVKRKLRFAKVFLKTQMNDWNMLR